jgi:hypothetical protein
MIQRCATLRELDTLIRGASHGKYSLEDVSVLDVRILISHERRKQFHLGSEVLEAAYDVFQEVIDLKQPDIILSLQCQTRTARNQLVSKLSASVHSGLRFELLKTGKNETRLVRGFHPSVYLQ